MATMIRTLGQRRPQKRGGLTRARTLLPRKRKAEPSPEEQERQKKRKETRDAVKAKADTRIIVSVDFGTTHIGIAFVTSTQTAKEVEVLSTWTGPQNTNEPRTPSRIAYASENSKFDENKWGDDVEAGDHMVQWFKLWLDANTKKSDFDDDLLNECVGGGLMRLPEGKDAKQVTTDFLSLVHGHVMKHLEKKIVPSTWSYAAREATRSAAKAAGFGSNPRDSVVLVDEAEASALCAIQTLEPKLAEETFPQNSCFIICDAGGGTVDLVTYRIISHNPLQLEEACVGQGGKIGGTAIDRTLYALMKERYGEAFDSIPIEKKGPKSDFMEAFEKIKRNWKGKDSRKNVYWLPLKMKMLDENDERMSAHYDFFDDKVRITSDDLEKMFEQILVKTFELIRKQARRTKEAQALSSRIRTVVLSGGLGESAYVFDRMKEFINGYFGEGKVELVNPVKSWSAVARGAAQHALLKNPIMFRRSRDCIGMVWHVPFAKRHLEEDKFWCPVMKQNRAANQMKWFVRKGDKMASNMRRRIDCYTVVKNTGNNIREVVIHQTLYRCSKSQAPTRFDESVVYEIGTIKLDVTKHVREEL